MAVSKAKLRLLAKYLEGETPNGVGEWGMHCPFHHDVNRSASLNVETELWYCNTCDIGGAVDELVTKIRNGEAPVAFWVDEDSPKQRAAKNGKAPEITEAQVRGWHSGLLSREEELEQLRYRRGLSLDTIKRWQIGWDTDQDAYTIPIRNVDGEVVNVRFYQLEPTNDRRKIWSVAGHGEPVLYPISMLEDNREIIVCEGEWDALLTIQNGFPAITRTGAAKVWKNSWNPLFEDKIVYICHDMDEPGQLGNSKVQGALQDYASEVRIVKLPYRVVPKHGKDLSDFWLAGFEAEEFKNILNDSEGVSRGRDSEVEMVDVRVLDSLDARKAGNKMRMRATIIGKKKENYLLPEEVDYTCTMDAGPQCQACPMLGYAGQAARHISSHDPILLQMMDSSNEQMDKLLRRVVGAQKCGRLEMESRVQRTVEILHVRSSVDESTADTADHTAREVVSVGSHDGEANRTVEIVGTIFPDPRKQTNRFQAWEVIRTSSSMEEFELTDDAIAQMLRFQPGPAGPVSKLNHIADHLAAGVTQIWGRRRVHALMDLVWHSVLTFNFAGIRERGWLDALIIGDTRTGKSQIASALSKWYQAGEVVSCESATFAGIVGGLQQLGGTKDWSITWGTIPLNDRRLVVLDEISGLTTEKIAQMSSIRSSGQAELTMIDRDKVWARTRLIWMGNPRNASMDKFTYGVYALDDLIGNKEDIARFDLAMSVRSSDVDKREINKDHQGESSGPYTQRACQTLLRWVWSRRADQVRWGVGAEDMVREMAIRLSDIFVEDPPLIQAANARYKLARVAVALAARTFSTDSTFENVVVETMHVRGAMEIILALYSDPGFGYRVVSEDRRAELKKASVQYDDAKEWLYDQPELVRFLTQQRTGHFRRQDLEDVLNLDREQARVITNKMFGYGLTRKNQANTEMEPILHEILRDLQKFGKE